MALLQGSFSTCSLVTNQSLRFGETSQLKLSFFKNLSPNLFCFRNTRPKNAIRNIKLAISAKLLPYPDPAHLITDRVIFEDVFSSGDASSLEQLRNLSSKRQEIEECLSGKYNSNAIFDDSDSITKRTLKLTESYLPPLYGLANELQNDIDAEVVNSSQPFFDLRWSSVMAHRSLLGNIVFFQSNTVEFESAMATFLYASLLRNLAFETMAVDNVEASSLLRKSSGVHSFLANQLNPRVYEIHVAEQKPYPPETFPAMAKIWAKICLAEAQALAAAKAEEKNSKFSLISKLYFGVCDLYGTAQMVLNDHSSQMGSISSTFHTYLRVSRIIMEVKAWKYMGKEKSENDEGGLALGVIKKAKHVLNDSKPPGEKEWRKIWDEEVEEINKLYKKFELENEQIYRENVPEIEKIFPMEALVIVEEISFEPPVSSLFLSLIPNESLI